VRSDSGSQAPTPGFYVWEIPGKISIQLSLDSVDRLQQDVMRGFGLVPRRGAEVGGILLGSMAGASVRVEDYELVPIEYKRGPSYRLSAQDTGAFQAALHKARNGNTPIGYFRSHTRDGVGLSAEDLELLSKHFPEPGAIALLIRPFATKPGLAGFYFKQAGAFQNGPPLVEFPFRRKDLAPAAAPASKLAPEPAREMVRTEPAPAHATSARSRRITMPVALLLLGLMLGYLAALGIHSSRAAPYDLALTVTSSGAGLQLNWARNSPAIRGAQRGTLTVEDGSYTKTTNLTKAELESGSAPACRPLTKHVVLRLNVFLNSRSNLEETIEWPAPSTPAPMNRR